MKTKLLLLLAAIFVFASCSNEPYEENVTGDFIIDLPGQIDDGITSGDGEDDLYEDDLIAGQNMDAGTVTVSVDANGNIVVTYVGDGWEIYETHVYIGAEEDMPATGSGNPQIGQFPYGDTYTVGETEVTVVGPNVNDFEEGECVYVAAHAVVVETATGQEETAWAAGTDMEGNSWAMGFNVCL